MKCGWLMVLMAAALAASDPQAPINVNSRYTVEKIDITDNGMTHISRTLREDLDRLVGQKVNQEMLDKLSRRIRRELNARFVAQKIARGTQPDQVIVLFEVKGPKPRQHFDLSMPRGVYHARQGWSGELDSKITVASSQFTLGVVSDGDELMERYAGLRAGYENRSVGTDRVRLGFQFASFHQKWNPATETALRDAPDVPGVYRTRQEFAPSVTLVLAEPLTLSVGTSFQRFQTQFPAARTEASNAVTTTLRYARQLEDSHANKHEVAAGYSLRAATKLLGTDFVYARHLWDAHYAFTHEKHTLRAGLVAGHAAGAVPLVERFVLGNTSTLRGWNKFDVNPLGGTRVAHGSFGYQYAWFEVFYDTGALWNKGEEAEAKESVGVGLRTKGGFFLACAFPIRSGRVEPIFMTGMSF